MVLAPLLRRQQHCSREDGLHDQTHPCVLLRFTAVSVYRSFRTGQQTLMSSSSTISRLFDQG